METDSLTEIIEPYKVINIISPRQHGKARTMEEKIFNVYFNDGVNCPIIVFEADTLEECKDWIKEQLKGKTPVNDEYPCTDDVMYSSRTFGYEVYKGSMIVEEDGEPVFNNCCYSSDFYYTD